jgi:hypothetical protein
MELVLLLGGASVALALTGTGRFSADTVLDLPYFTNAKVTT